MVINLTSIWPNEINVGKVQEKYVGLLGFSFHLVQLTTIRRSVKQAPGR